MHVYVCAYASVLTGVSLSPKSHIMTTEEILRLANLFVDLGVTKIRLTGPTPFLSFLLSLSHAPSFLLFHSLASSLCPPPFFPFPPATISTLNLSRGPTLSSHSLPHTHSLSHFLCLSLSHSLTHTHTLPPAPLSTLNLSRGLI